VGPITKGNVLSSADIREFGWPGHSLPNQCKRFLFGGLVYCNRRQSIYALHVANLAGKTISQDHPGCGTALRISGFCNDYRFWISASNGRFELVFVGFDGVLLNFKNL
jgi:hypothetical protein